MNLYEVEEEIVIRRKHSVVAGEGEQATKIVEAQSEDENVVKRLMTWRTVTPNYRPFKPQVSQAEEEWHWSGDLRPYMNVADNHLATMVIRSRIKDIEYQPDPESACSYFYFKTRQDGLRFVDALNELIASL